MQTRRVEVAIGFADLTWRDLWVDVEEDPDHVLDDDELSAKAEEVVTAMAIKGGWNVTFVHVIYVETPDDMDGIV